MAKDSADKNTDFLFENGDHIFFTSDTHFNHANIIKFCNRPFTDTAEMDAKLIENWNSVVGKDDIVYHLGDFAWGGTQVWRPLLEKLNGHIHLVLGNHDFKNLNQTVAPFFKTINQQLYIRVGDQPIYLNHYPFLTYGGVYRKTPVWQLFGHVHTTSEDNPTAGKDNDRMVHLFPCQYDVGVDQNNYTPVSFNQVKEIIEKQIKESENPNKKEIVLIALDYSNLKKILLNADDMHYAVINSTTYKYLLSKSKYNDIDSPLETIEDPLSLYCGGGFGGINLYVDPLKSDTDYNITLLKDIKDYKA